MVYIYIRQFFYQLKTVTVQDMINFNNMMFIYKVYTYILLGNITLYFQNVNDSQNNNMIVKNVNFKILFSRTSKTA